MKLIRYNQTYRPVSRSIKMLFVLICAAILAQLSACSSADSDVVSGESNDSSIVESEDATLVWTNVRNALDASDISSLTLVVGNAQGNIFVYEKGISTIDTVYELASGTKWLAASAIMQLVESGVLSLDDRPQDYIEWWDEDVNGVRLNSSRTQVTLRQLLSFTSGFGGNGFVLECVSDPSVTIEECVRDIHDNYFASEPGQFFYYGPAHLQVAGLMAEKATGKPWRDIFAEEISTPLSLQKTSYVEASVDNPRIAGGAQSNAREYAVFLQALLSGAILQQSMQQMYFDHTKNVVMLESFVIRQLGYDWHYGFGQWRECKQPSWVEDCERLVSISSPGAYGWYPWIDVERGYFGVLAMQLPLQEPDTPPEQSISLADQVRSLVEGNM